MALFQIVTVLGLFALAYGDVNEIVGNNQYLPPNKGYNYDRPSPAFPSSPAPRPTNSYRPPPPSPTYQSPTPSYQPPAPTPSYRPPAPTYGAPAAPRPSVISRPSAPGPVYTPSIAAPSGTNGVSVPVDNHDHGHDHHHEPGMPYDFEYKVKDDYFGTDYSRNEVSDGDVIRGEYRVQLPDGRLQIVKYTADWKNGFNADVSYEGEPTYPTGAGSSGSGSVAPYPSSNSPSNSYGPPPSPSAPSSNYGPPRSGY